jgi:hypothetical protein
MASFAFNYISSAQTVSATEQCLKLGRGVNILRYDIAFWKDHTKGRFGVRYNAFVARTAEKLGFCWAYWQFESDFIVYNIDKECWVGPILNALMNIPSK